MTGDRTASATVLPQRLLAAEGTTRTGTRVMAMGGGAAHCTALVMNSTIHKRDEIGSSVQEKLKFGKSSVKLLRLFWQCTMFLSACAAVLLQSIIYSRCLTAVTTDSHINGLFPSCFDLSRSTRQAGP